MEKVKALCPRCGGLVCRGGNAKGVQRFRCKACLWNGVNPVGLDTDQARGIDAKVSKALRAKIKGRRGVQRYIVTAAQNATPVHKRFFASLLSFCKARRAQLIVIPYRYKNPTSMWSKDAEHDDWWAPELAPYLLDQRTELNKHLVVLADIKTQPTATRPTSGFETITGARSAIVGHPKIELVCVPTPQSKMAKIITSTGAVTERNYLQAKAGKKAEHHHSFGATIVEVDGNKFHIRQANACNDGSFMDLDAEYRGAAVERNIPLDVLAMGDTHEEVIDPTVVKATFLGAGSMVGKLKPKRLVWHDLHDFYSQNHHHRGEVFVKLVKHRTGRGNVENYLNKTFDFVDRVTPAGTINVFVPSNHPDALMRWVKETDPRTDPENCVFWAEIFKVLADNAKWTATGASTIDPFTYLAKRRLKCADRTVFLGRGDSYAVHGVEYAFHGDAGSNGARGSIMGFSKIGVKTVTGHGHTPGIIDGAYRVGTSTPPGLEYTHGAPSSWMNTHCFGYRNGKRSLAFIINGEWTA